MYNQDGDSRWWDGGEPLWVTAMRQNLKTATFFWPGSDQKIRGMRPNYWKKYDGKITFEERIEQCLTWLEQGLQQKFLVACHATLHPTLSVGRSIGNILFFS